MWQVHKIKIQVSSSINWIFFREQWKLVDNLVVCYAYYQAHEPLNWHSEYKFMLFDTHHDLLSFQLVDECADIYDIQ